MRAITLPIAQRIPSPVEIEQGEDTMLVNMNEAPMAVPPAIKRKVNEDLHRMGNYADDGVPLQIILDRCERAGLIAVMEDGCRWSGFLCGAHECGSEKAKEQMHVFPLAMWSEKDGCHRLTKLGLSLSWGTLYAANGKRRWEFVTYVN